MRVRDVQRIIDAAYPGAWCATRNQTGFCLTRVDSVELISIGELASICSRFREHQSYVTMEPVSKWAADGALLAVWLVAHRTARTSRTIRKRRKAGK